MILYIHTVLEHLQSEMHFSIKTRIGNKGVSISRVVPILWAKNRCYFCPTIWMSLTLTCLNAATLLIWSCGPGDVFELFDFFELLEISRTTSRSLPPSNAKIPFWMEVFTFRTQSRHPTLQGERRMRGRHKECSTFTNQFINLTPNPLPLVAFGYLVLPIYPLL